MSTTMYKKTLSKSLLKFLIKKDILGLFFYSLMLYDKHFTPKDTITNVENMPSWLRINEVLEQYGYKSQLIRWSTLSRMFNSGIKNSTEKFELIMCFVSNDSNYNCLTCVNFNAFLCDSFYIPEDNVKYNIPKDLYN